MVLILLTENGDELSILQRIPDADVRRILPPVVEDVTYPDEGQSLGLADRVNDCQVCSFLLANLTSLVPRHDVRVELVVTQPFQQFVVIGYCPLYYC